MIEMECVHRYFLINGIFGEFSQGGSNSFRLSRLVYFSDSIVFLRDYVPDSLDVFFFLFPFVGHSELNGILWGRPTSFGNDEQYLGILKKKVILL